MRPPSGLQHTSAALPYLSVAVPFVCPVTCGWTRALLPFLAATNKAAMTIHVPKTTLMLVNILTFW